MAGTKEARNGSVVAGSIYLSPNIGKKVNLCYMKMTSESSLVLTLVMVTISIFNLS